MSKAAYTGVDGIARKVKKMYVGAPTAVGMSRNLLPVYALWLESTYGVSHVRNADGSIHVSGTAQSNSTVYLVSPDMRWHLPGGNYTLSMGGKMPDGMHIIFEYYSEDGAGWLGNYGAINANNAFVTARIEETQSVAVYIRVNQGSSVDITLYPQLESGSEATEYVPYGEEIRSVARKVKKAYIGVDGVARQFFSAEFMSYTGEYEVLQVEYEGKTCNLYRLKKSGILTLNDDALFWMCGGGGKGGNGSYENYKDSNGVRVANAFGGNGGRGGSVLSGAIEAGNNWVVSIGTGGDITGTGTSSITDGVTTHQTDTKGSSGYGPGGNTKDWSNGPSGGKGSGVSTFPFGIAALKAHCGAGGGGAAGDDGGGGPGRTLHFSYAGHGGSNGGNGSDCLMRSTTSTESDYSGGNGGAYGGGRGDGIDHESNSSPNWKPYYGANASFYGSGGGGGAAWLEYGDVYDGVLGDTFKTNGHSGYQGVVYILDVNGGVTA